MPGPDVQAQPSAGPVGPAPAGSVGHAPAGPGAPPDPNTLTASVPAGLPSEDLYVPAQLADHGPVVVGWGVFLALGLALGVLAWKRRLPTPPLPSLSASISRRELGVALLATLALAVVASWPMAVTGRDVALSIQIKRERCTLQDPFAKGSGRRVPY